MIFVKKWFDYFFIQFGGSIIFRNEQIHQQYRSQQMIKIKDAKNPRKKIIKEIDKSKGNPKS